jgi:hypothetical protein
LTEAKLLAEQSRARAAAHCLRGGIFKVARAVVAEQRLMRRMKAAPPA